MAPRKWRGEAQLPLLGSSVTVVSFHLSGKSSKKSFNFCPISPDCKQMWIQFSIQLYSKHISSHCNALWGVSKMHCDFTPQMHIKKIAKSKGGQLGRKKTIFWRHPFYILCHLLSVKQGFFNGSWLLFPSKKIPSEMEVAPRCKLLTLLTLLMWFTLLTLLTLFILLKLLYTAKTVACMPVYIYC